MGKNRKPHSTRVIDGVDDVHLKQVECDPRRLAASHAQQKMAECKLSRVIVRAAKNCDVIEFIGRSAKTSGKLVIRGSFDWPMSRHLGVRLQPISDAGHKETAAIKIEPTRLEAINQQLKVAIKSMERLEANVDKLARTQPPKTCETAD